MSSQVKVPLRVCTSFMDSSGAALCPSVGSIGHPNFCSQACKYNGKLTGCKDGRLCVRCHLCAWQRHSTRAFLEDLQVADARAGDEGSAANTPDPPSVMTWLGEAISLPAGAETPPQDVRPGGIVTELQSKLEELQHKLALQEGRASANAAPAEVGARCGAAPAIEPPPGLPQPAGADGLQASSIGSVGHPSSCGTACKYVRRKGGCSSGAACPDCHQCQWRRERFNKEQDPLSGAAMSVGTQGHPETCGKACKYGRRKTGCRNGASCMDCHKCLWRRESRNAGGSTPLADGEAAMGGLVGAIAPAGAVSFNDTLLCGTVADGPADGALCPSVGSIGHPFYCSGQGCKYNGKAKGCKDGSLCVRCHLCPWRRYQSIETGGAGHSSTL